MTESVLPDLKTNFRQYSGKVVDGKALPLPQRAYGRGSTVGLENSERGTTTFEEILSQDGKLVYKVKGVSMLPMLRQNRDLVVIAPPQGRLQKYDVALYRRGSAYDGRLPD